MTGRQVMLLAVLGLESRDVFMLVSLNGACRQHEE
jgi:hypothetical protein